MQVEAGAEQQTPSRSARQIKHTHLHLKCRHGNRIMVVTYLLFSSKGEQKEQALN